MNSQRHTAALPFLILSVLSAQDCSDNVGSRTMQASHGDSTSDTAGLDRASVGSTESLFTDSSEADTDDRQKWP